VPTVSGIATDFASPMSSNALRSKSEPAGAAAARFGRHAMQSPEIGSMLVATTWPLRLVLLFLGAAGDAGFHFGTPRTLMPSRSRMALASAWLRGLVSARWSPSAWRLELDERDPSLAHPAERCLDLPVAVGDAEAGASALDRLDEVAERREPLAREHVVDDSEVEAELRRRAAARI
jgi:hypothetical protein